MRILDFLVDTFINTFGITRPSASGRRAASYLILALLSLLIVGLVLVGLLLRGAVR